MADEQNEKQKQEEKELKRLLDAHVLVLKNKLGRTPTMDEIQESLGKGEETEAAHIPVASEKPESGEPVQEVKSPSVKHNTDAELVKNEEGEELSPEEIDSEPKILNTKVYYGMADAEDGSKRSDPHKVLYYELPDNRCYCCETQEWLSERPSVLDHLPSRPIEYSERDIVNAIAHGVMDDSDYDALEKTGIMTETPRKLWGLVKKLKTQMEELEKSEESDEEVESNAEEDDPRTLPEDDSDSEIEVDQDYEHAGHAEASGDDMVKYFLDAAGVDGSEKEELVEVLGEDVMARIMETATKLALSGLEEQIREIVRDELGKGSDSEELEFETEGSAFEDEAEPEEPEELSEEDLT